MSWLIVIVIFCKIVCSILQTYIKTIFLIFFSISYFAIQCFYMVAIVAAPSSSVGLLRAVKLSIEAAVQAEMKYFSLL